MYKLMSKFDIEFIIRLRASLSIPSDKSSLTKMPISLNIARIIQLIKKCINKFYIFNTRKN